jgi:putative transposase
MADQNGFGNDGTKSTGLRQPYQGHDQMNKKDENVAHRGIVSKLTKLARIWPNFVIRDRGWRSALEFVRPETVIGWQRQRFKRYWWSLSQPRRLGRPRVYLEIRELVRAMAAANPIWGAPRIHGELLKLGFEISERTISR